MFQRGVFLTCTCQSYVSEGSISDKVYINPEHGSELQTQLTKLWQEGKFFDASLEVDDYRLPVSDSIDCLSINHMTEVCYCVPRFSVTNSFFVLVSGGYCPLAC